MEKGIGREGQLLYRFSLGMIPDMVKRERAPRPARGIQGRRHKPDQAPRRGKGEASAHEV
ncbi:MAG: hypothetical protein C4524_00985 [Candidatus Zixiibacteriota bacterium]|nr:MAG: hypothetical protein C4524_00985 [candidate division Zixibacteria bacterium]